MMTPESHALAGKKILITRTRRQASTLAERLEAHGAETLVIPTIEIAEPASWDALDHALERLEDFDWVLFTSANAVRAFAQRALHPGRKVEPKRVAVIGPATAREAQAHGLRVDLIPGRYVAESLAEALLPEACGSRMLLVRAEQARDVLPEILTAAGAEITIAPAYRNIIPIASIDLLRQAFASTDRVPDAITFTSSSTATNFFALVEAAGPALESRIVLASIGPVTTQTLVELEHPPQIEAREANIDALVEALAYWFAKDTASAVPYVPKLPDGFSR